MEERNNQKAIEAELEKIRRMQEENQFEAAGRMSVSTARLSVKNRLI